MAEPGRRNKPVTRSRTDRSLSISGERGCKENIPGKTKNYLRLPVRKQVEVAALLGDVAQAPSGERHCKWQCHGGASR
jgi:hypothetical protein